MLVYIKCRQINSSLQRLKTQTHNQGFTLVELLITLAILGILAAIVVPSYNAQVRKSNRSEAITTLTQIAQDLERCRSDTLSYVAGNPGCIDHNIDPTPPIENPRPTPGGHYTITAQQNAATFLITATAASTMQLSDTECNQFTLDHTGRRYAQNTGGAETTDKCWR